MDEAYKKTISWVDLLLGEGVSTAEWGKGFISKYAKWILIIGFFWVFVKGFGVKIKV